MVLHNSVDGGDNNTTKADCGVDEDIEKWVAVNSGQSRGVDGREFWIDEKNVYVWRRRGGLLESELLLL